MEVYKLDKKIIKKSGNLEDFKMEKIICAIEKSAYRALVEISNDDLFIFKDEVIKLCKLQKGDIPISIMHIIVENSLDRINPLIAKSYREYRNYKQDFADIIDDAYKKAKALEYRGDNSNANTDSALVSTKRSLIYSELNKGFYKKFNLTPLENQLIKDGYIYIHDMSARRDSLNCCLFDIANVLNNGFELGNLWYNEPSTLDKAFDVMSDVIFAAASQQYGGLTVGSIETVLNKYAEKSFTKFFSKYIRIGLTEEEAELQALEDIEENFRDGFQGWEYKFNTVSSSRGDYPFITVTAGTGTKRFEQMATRIMFEVRKSGQGKKHFKRPVLFPKLVFLYDEELHGEGKELEYLFEGALDCSMEAMYPDYLSLTGDDDHISVMYKKYGKIISPMG